VNTESTTIRHRQVPVGDGCVHVAEAGPADGPAYLLSAHQGIPSPACRAEQAAAYADPGGPGR